MSFVDIAQVHIQRKALVRSFIGTCILVLVLGCASTGGDYDPPSLHEVSAEKIEKSLEEGKIAKAVMEHHHLRKRDEVPQEKIERLWSSILNKWRESYHTSLEDKDYRRAIRLAITAEQGEFTEEVSGELQDSGEGEFLDELKKRYILYLAEGDFPIGALALLRDFVSYEPFSMEELEKLLQVAEQERKRTVIASLTEEIEDRLEKKDQDEQKKLSEGDRQSEEEEKPDRTYSHEELISSTVTIWVNRGMRIQSGVGMPDRVIGSGFYIDKRGYILTNYHVVKSEVDPEYDGYSRLYVRPSENSKLKIPARVVGWDPVFDIALLKVERDVDTVLSFSPSVTRRSGERIYAIGSPAGLENTVTSGIVSASGRRFLQMGDVMQVDVPINQGNSGGPLLDDSGHLIGLVYAGIEQFEGVNFAIPAEWVLRVLNDLYGEKKVKHSFFGAAVEEVDDELEVSYVYPGGPAEKMGIRAGDILQSIGGTEVQEIVDAQRIMLKYDPDTLIRFRWKSKDSRKEGVASLVDRPDVPMEKAVQKDRRERLFAPLFGMQVEKTENSLFRTRYRVKEIYRGSIADDVGLSVNDPFSIQKWELMEKEGVVLTQIRIKKRKAGFLETGVQLGNYLEINNMI
ncbi:MAG: S1C family serine protease [Spirochaetaceae bacterium]